MTYAPDELDRMKTSLGITDEDIKKIKEGSNSDSYGFKTLEVFVYKDNGKYLAAYGEGDTNKNKHAESLTEFSNEFFSDFDFEGDYSSIRFVKFHFKDITGKISGKFTDDEWDSFYDMLKAFYEPAYSISTSLKYYKEDNNVRSTIEFKKNLS